jgi:hypothetical protein
MLAEIQNVSLKVEKLVDLCCFLFLFFCDHRDSRHDTDEVHPLATDTQICVTTSVVLFAIYVATLHPSVPGGDSGQCLLCPCCFFCFVYSWNANFSCECLQCGHLPGILSCKSHKN